MSCAPEIMRVLVASTAHITEAEAKRFDAKDPPGELGGTLTWEYGCIVYVGDRKDHCLALEDMSLGLAGVVNWAWDNQCDWVRFDCDGTTYDHLTRYDW